MTKKVTERDFRMPEFRDANPEDYEFRGDGKIVRKDRWETGIRRIASIFNNYNFEVEEIVETVRDLAAKLEVCNCKSSNLEWNTMTSEPHHGQIVTVLLDDGSIITNVEYAVLDGDCTFRKYGVDLFSQVIKWTAQED
jgi:hypothetical protein